MSTPRITPARDHDPASDLSVLSAQLEGLKENMAERDRRYEDRFKAQETAVQSALTAQKELTTSAFASSEKAIVKAEEAQKSYNATHNDLNRKMDEQYKTMIPRPEADSRIAMIDTRVGELKESMSAVRLELMKEIGNLRESRSDAGGENRGRISQREFLMGLAALLIAVIVMIVKLVH